MDRTKLDEVEHRLKEIRDQKQALGEEERDLNQLAAELRFAASKYEIGQRWLLRRGPTQTRTVEVLGPAPPRWSDEGFRLRMVAIKKGTGEHGKPFLLDPFDFKQLAPLPPEVTP